jgi:ribose transport system ATP-binding protein
MGRQDLIVGGGETVLDMQTFEEITSSDHDLADGAQRRLHATGLRKSFGAVEVLHGVDLDLMAGEVHALLGENGAGKSTIINMLSGRIFPDSGQVELDQKVINFNNPLAAKRAGVSIIAQELELVPTLSILENIFLGAEPTKFGIIRWREAREKVAAVLKELGIDAEPSRLTRTLSVADQQLVEIAKAIIGDFRVLIMDEPTSALNLEETSRLFKIISRFKAAGVAILYVSHRLWEVFDIADRVTVLRDGEVVQRSLIKDTNTAHVIQSMLGPKSSLISGAPGRSKRSSGQSGVPVFEIRELNSGGVLSNVSISVDAGEVVGLAGVLGSGRTELCEAIYGLRKVDPGTKILIKGRAVELDQPKTSSRHGIFFLTEDRKQEGIFPQLDLRENVVLPNVLDRSDRAKSNSVARSNLVKVTGFGVVSAQDELSRFEEMRRSLNIKCSGSRNNVTQLSGGNQQKVLFARGRIAKPFVMILSEPTRGVDVGAKEEIYAAIDQLAGDGTAIIVSSSEIPELLRLCTRIWILRHGKVVSEVNSAETDEEAILETMAG